MKMTPAAAADLLQHMASYDNRKPNPAAPAAWAKALENFDPDMCRAAVTAHYMETSDFVMPSHIIAICRPWIRTAKEAAAQEQEKAEIEGRPVRTAIDRLAIGWDIDR